MFGINTKPVPPIHVVIHDWMTSHRKEQRLGQYFITTYCFSDYSNPELWYSEHDTAALLWKLYKEQGWTP